MRVGTAVHDALHRGEALPEAELRKVCVEDAVHVFGDEFILLPVLAKLRAGAHGER